MTEFGYEREDKSVQRVLNGLQEVIRRGPHAIRIMGSGVLDLCYVACGRLDACYCGLAGEGWKPWDYAAAGLLLTEAGGSMSKLNGEPFDLYGSNMIAASTLSLRKDIQDALNYY